MWEAQIMLSILLFLYIIGLVTAPFCVGVFVRQQNYLYNIIILVAEGVKLAILFSLLFGVSTRVLWLVVAQAAASLIEKFLLLRASLKLMPTLKPSFRLEWPPLIDHGSRRIDQPDTGLSQAVVRSPGGREQSDDIGLQTNGGQLESD